jgi:hypothetical protein
MKKKSLLLIALATLGLTASTMAQNLPNYIPANGLVGWWPFNGNANDESGNGNDGTVNGATLTEDRFGNVDESYLFSENTNISCPIESSDFGNDFTISMWCKFLGYTNGNEYPTILIGENYNFVLQFTNTVNPPVLQSFFGSTTPGQYDGLTRAVHSVGEWVHILILNNEGITTIKFNGNTFGVSEQASIFQSGTFGQTIRIGGGFQVPAENFNGTLDDIAIYNRALTQQEIIALYNASNCPSNTAINPQINSLSAGSIATFNATTSDPNPSYVWQSNLGQGFQTLNDLENYSGTNTSSLSIANVQLSEHNQPIRVITTSGECVDTSDIATISILDTCVTSINDTTFVTVTDTLVINTLITGINPPNNSNTIKVYPNPANTHITIEYGDFAIMNGYQLRIENSLGQEVFQTSITQESDYLNLNSWGGNGLYFVHIVDPQGNTIDIRKIVLQ